MSDKTSDKNVATEEDVKILKEFMNLKANKPFRFVEISYPRLQEALENILVEREQDKKYIKNLELALKIINRVTDIDETKEENIALLKEVLRMLDERYEV